MNLEDLRACYSSTADFQESLLKTKTKTKHLSHQMVHFPLNFGVEICN